MMPHYEWVSVHEASRRLNRSVSTIRRMIESGELVGEREPLARGSTRDRYRVRLEAPDAPGVTHHDAPPPSTVDAPVTLHDAPAVTEAALKILDALLVANAETMDRQGERIAALERENGTLMAQRDASAARADDLARQLADERAARLAAERRRRWWWPFG